MRVRYVVHSIKLREQSTTKEVVQADGGHKEGSKEGNEQELTAVGGQRGGGLEI